MADKEKTMVTGLDQAENRKEAEYDLVASLLAAADFKNDNDTITEAVIKRGDKYLFSVHLHPLSDPDLRIARKKATVYMPNPNGKKLPQIEKEFKTGVFSSWMIYLATTEADQQKIWGNPAIMQKFGLMQPVESIDVLLTLGEKQRLMELVTDISGMDEDGNPDEENMDEEEYAKN